MKKRKLTVLHTESSMGWGGQEIRIFQESLRFTEHGHRMLIACQRESQIAEHAERAGLPVFIVQMRFAGDPVAIVQLLSIIRREKVDVIHTHSSKDSWITGIAARISMTPVVRSRHLSTPVGKSWSSTFVYRYLADFVVTSGNQIREELINSNNLNPGKIVSIPAGVDTEHFDINRVSGTKVLQEFNLNGAFPIIGVVAVLRSWKGHRYLIESLPDIVARYPQVKILIVGNGPQWNNLQNQIRELGLDNHVIMTGFRDDVPEIIAALDIFVLPSVASEATSQVIPQSLAMGKPVVATNTGGLPEIVENNVTGLLIPPRDCNAIANAIIKISENREEAEKMAIRGRERILRDFTFKGMIDRTTEVYYNLLNDSVNIRHH
jgi:glycosyltransferase involved in cell wall biosynthesis